MEKEYLEKLVEVEQRSKSNTKRIDELQLVTKAFYELASDVKVMAQQMLDMKEDISDIKEKVDEKSNETNKIAFNLKNALVNAVAMAIIGGIMALIIK